MDVVEVIERYRALYTKYRGRPPIRPRSRNKEDIDAAKVLLGWCAEKGIDPQRLMEARFAQLWEAKQQLPRFAGLRSEKFVYSLQVEAASAAAASTQVALFDQTVRDLTRQHPGNEQVRRRYCFEQQSALCIENEMSGGYDPRSRYCPTCPQAVACAAKLQKKWGFDVVALRLGRLDQVPMTVRKALRGWDGGLSV